MRLKSDIKKLISSEARENPQAFRKQRSYSMFYIGSGAPPQPGGGTWRKTGATGGTGGKPATRGQTAQLGATRNRQRAPPAQLGARATSDGPPAQNRRQPATGPNRGKQRKRRTVATRRNG